MKFVRLVPLLAILAAILLLVAGPGSRLGLWEFGFGFTLMRWALYGGVAAAVLGIVLILIPRTRSGHLAGLLGAVVIGLGTAAVPWLWLQHAQSESVPKIHDISTDTIDPPEFVAVAPLRADAPNPVEYAGEETAQKQREAYPEIQPLEIEAYPAIAFDHALAAAEAMDWEIVEANEEEGRIEATDTTFWFGFKDDVVIRIRANNGNSVLDVRSKSRIGQSDVGANAARIRKYLEELEARLS